MITTFLLHGGRLRLDDERNDTYFRRLGEGLVEGDTLLHIPFARSPQDQQKVFETEKEQILAQTDQKINVIMASREKLIDQIAQAKIVHITGGKSPKLVTIMAGYDDFISAIGGKTIGGSSAGACLFSSIYWYGEKNEILKGLGLFDIALLVHYGSEKFNATDNELEILKQRSKGLEVLTLEEAQWIERKVNI